MSTLSLISVAAALSTSVAADNAQTSGSITACSGTMLVVENVARLRGAEADLASAELARIVLATPGLPLSARTPLLQRTRGAGFLKVVSRQVTCNSTESGESLVADPADLPNTSLDPNARPGTTMIYSACDPVTSYSATYHLHYVGDSDGSPATRDPGWIAEKVVIERLTAGCPLE